VYQTIKLIHISCAVISLTGFTIRGLLALMESSYLQQRWLKIGPHLVDTLLLGSAIYLAMASRQYPGQDGWLTAKFLALLVYIVAGMWVMRFAKTQSQRLAAYTIAIASFSYILAVALSRNPVPWS
jgi:uncharacterized membrane protein SirB2